MKERLHCQLCQIIPYCFPGRAKSKLFGRSSLCRSERPNGRANLAAAVGGGLCHCPDHLQGPQARIPQNCCGDCCGNCRGNSGCWGKCWGNCRSDCRGDCRFSALQSKGRPPTSLQSSCPSTSLSTPNFPAAVSAAVLGNPGLGAL